MRTMGLFSTRSAPPASDVPTPISRDRLVRLFEEQGWKYYIDNEGDLGGNWDDNQFYFMLRGADSEILHIQSMWHTTLDIEHLEEVRLFIDTWHRDRLWPKCYHRISDEGRIRVFAKHTVDMEHGATDAQLLQQVRCALGTATQFYDEITRGLGV